MNEENNQPRVFIGQCSKFTANGKKSILETEFHNIRVKSSKNVYLNAHLTSFGLIDAMQYEDEETLDSFFNDFAKDTLKAKTEEDLQYINDFLNACLGLSDKVDFFIKQLQDYIEITGPNIIKLTEKQRTELINDLDKKINSRRNNKTNNTSALQTYIERKDKLDLLAAELDNKPMKDPEEYFDLARDYEDLIFDISQLEKQNKSNSKDIEALKDSAYDQCSRLKKIAEKLESIGEITKQI